MNNSPHSTAIRGFSSPTNEGMDVIIISTNHPMQKKLWEKKLHLARDELFKPGAKWVVVLEEWKGGAGNGLGTLYAYQHAALHAKKEWGIDLQELMLRGGTVAIYHTAGYGKRLFPLVGSEFNNKGAVKLPGTKGLIQDPITILEAVIKQTTLIAPSLCGRLAVFWGDQLFIPSQPLHSPTSSVCLIGAKISLPSEEEWNNKHFSQYGILAKDQKGLISLLDKVDYSSFCRHQEKECYLSLGCFSLTLSLLNALLEEFSPELTKKTGSLDTDPHFWMAATTSEEEYVFLMTKKGMDPLLAQALHRRISKMHPILEVQDIGEQALFWDFGNVSSYYTNTLKLCENSEEGALMRSFFAIPEHRQILSHLDVDSSSILINCSIKRGIIRRSVLVGVVAEELHAEESVILYSDFGQATLTKSLLYQVKESNPYAPPEGTVRADIQASTPLAFTTSLKRNGKEDWNVCLPSNPCSYADLEIL